MNSITKVSEITYTDVAEYLHIAELTADEITLIDNLIGVAKDYILKYTGIADLNTLDNYQSMVIVVFILVQDMFDNRTLYLGTNNANKITPNATVETILGMYQINLL